MIQLTDIWHDLQMRNKQWGKISRELHNLRWFSRYEMWQCQELWPESVLIDADGITIKGIWKFSLYDERWLYKYDELLKKWEVLLNQIPNADIGRKLLAFFNALEREGVKYQSSRNDFIEKVMWLALDETYWLLGNSPAWVVVWRNWYDHLWNTLTPYCRDIRSATKNSSLKVRRLLDS